MEWIELSLRLTLLKDTVKGRAKIVQEQGASYAEALASATILLRFDVHASTSDNILHFLDLP